VLRKMRAALPDAIIVVGRWAPAELVDEDRQSLIDAGATQVAATLLETRDQLCRLAAEMRQRGTPSATDAA
jgi:hypothetical protein